MHWTLHAYFWPVFWIGFWAVRSAIKHRRRMEELRISAAAPAAPLSTDSELTELRDRIKVLERITVDANSHEQVRSREIAEEIEALRDK